MASLLGNLIFAGQQTLLTTQAALGAVNGTANLFSIATGALQSLDVALFTPAVLAGPTFGAGVGQGACTLPALLYTRSGATVVWMNPNTTALPGDMLAAYFHSLVR